MANNLRAPVDALGQIRAQIKQLEEKETGLKASIAEMGVGEYEGHNYIAEVLKTERNNLDMTAVRAKLSPQFIAAHTTTTKITTVKCKPIMDRFRPDVDGQSIEVRRK